MLEKSEVEAGIPGFNSVGEPVRRLVTDGYDLQAHKSKTLAPREQYHPHRALTSISAIDLFRCDQAERKCPQLKPRRRRQSCC